MRILLIETATQVCSVAIGEEGHLVASRESLEPNAHSTKLMVFIDEMLKEKGLHPADLDAVCVSSGPGSYTGLRIGVSSAKGLCYALEKQLIAVPTLLSMAAQFYRQHADYKGYVCPMIDARRMECYTMMVGPNLEVLKPTSADVVTEGLYNQWFEQGEVMFIGDGAEKTQPILGFHVNALYDNGFRISAEGMLDLAEAKLRKGEVEDVAYFEPYYLKDFVAKKSVVHGLRD